MKKRTVAVLAAGFFTLSVAAAAEIPKQKLYLQAEQAGFNAERVEIIERKPFGDGKGVMLKPGLTADFANVSGKPDVVFTFTIQEPGRYWVETVCDTTGATRARMPLVKNSRDTPTALIAVGSQEPKEQVVILPWRSQDYFRAQIQRYDFAVGQHQVKVWLPPEVGLDQLRIVPYLPPAVPEAAQNYAPPVRPPAGHPRVWVTGETLPSVKENLTKGENRAIWEKIKAEAGEVMERGQTGGYSATLQKLLEKKAFVFLMTGDRAIGREAAELAIPYFKQLHFSNNLSGETRQMGQAVYTAALMYDWCYDLLTSEERQILLDAMLRIPEDMEIGWPPFLQSVVNGHGGEDQLNRELLAMAIAVYDEDPIPYRYCAFQLFERLIPMRAFEYQSGRHNQGSSYGPYRLSCEMNAAWLLRRMANREVFDPNIKNVYYFWLYGLLPGGRRFILDGDANPGGAWHLARCAYLSYTYAADPLIKGDFLRQGSAIADPIVFLLLNDPGLEPSLSPEQLPLTHDFGPVLPALIARTGWNLTADSSDVVVEMKAGGYYFGNHQHPDVGGFQIFHRGVLADDLGRYKFYGRPYDRSYNKRTIAHNAMLVYDPNEKFLGDSANDGGQRYLSAYPQDLNELLNDPQFKVGTRLNADFGPDQQRPAYTYLQGDIAAAYTSKVEDYVRSFCFLNLGLENTPAALIITDRITTARPEFRKYWLLNSPVTPQETADGLLFQLTGEAGRGKMILKMPAPADVRRETAADNDMYRFFGQEIEPPHPDVAPAPGASRTMFTPAAERKSDLFVAVILIGDSLPVDYRERDGLVRLQLADRLVIMNPEKAPYRTEIRFEVPADGKEHQVLLAGLAAGRWQLTGDKKQRFEVESGRGAWFARLSGGNYRAAPLAGK